MGRCSKREATEGVKEQQLWTEWMEVLLARASVNGDRGEVPVAAVILDEQGRCIGHGRNRRERCQDPLGHAELVALSPVSYTHLTLPTTRCV